MKIIIKIYYSFKKYIIADFGDIKKYNEIFLMKFRNSEVVYYDDILKYHFISKEYKLYGKNNNINNKGKTTSLIVDFNYSFYKKLFNNVYNL